MHSELFFGTHVIVQGITGKHGAFHTSAMRAAGTPIVAGTSPGKAGQVVDGIPVYSTVAAIKNDMPVDTSIIFVPAPHATAALMEAIEAHIPLIICITEGIPIHDMVAVALAAKAAGVTLIGPNCPGVLIPGGNKLGIIPATMALEGTVGIVSRSGTLTYEVAAGLSARGVGQRYIIGIGGDPIRGTGFTDCLELFEHDPLVTTIVLIGEIGGHDERLAARFMRSHVTKPVYAYIAGHSAPPGVQLGHAGAILGSDSESAAAKTAALKKAGAFTATSIVDLINSIPSTRA